MKTYTYLSGVGVFALAGALAATPAYASERETFEEVTAEDVGNAEVPPTQSDYRLPSAVPAPAPAAAPVSLTPQSSFGGLQADVYDIEIEPTLNFITRPLGGDLIASGYQIEPRIFVRDDVGLDASFDADDTQPSVVQIFSLNNATGGLFLNCTGSVINPRTILTAAHCLNSAPSESYGLPETGAATTMLIGTGPDTLPQVLNTLFEGAGYAEGGLAFSTDVVIHASANPENGGLPFPFADIALIAVDTPITDVPALPVLLTPLTELTHVVHVGYGSFGTALGGPGQGSNTLRRIGENMLGAVASFADFDDVVFSAFAPNSDFGSITQPYYFTDFDWPDRDAAGFNGCDFNGFGPECTTVGDVISIDWFDGDALPREVATAPGDSGSPLIVDELYGQNVITAVLSGGVSFFDLSGFGLTNTYGDISFYTPIYPFFEFLSENTAYKYVSAKNGDSVWSDGSHWTQDLDPGFLIDDGTGTLVNGIPSGSEPGIFETGPNVGTILGVDISGFPEVVSPFGPQPGDENFGANTPNSSALLGAGSTGFVPQNTDGTPGIAFANPAQYFEVHLSRRGTTTVDLDVEIDKLVIDHSRAGFVLPDEWEFTSIIGVEQFSGLAEINGTLNTSIYTLAGGELEGDGGTINTNVLFNLQGLMSAGGTNGFGTLTINGDYVQTSAGALWADFSIGRRSIVTKDFYDIAGVAVLDGDLILSSRDRRVRFGTEFSILSADAIDGDFATVTFISRSPILAAEHRIEGGDVVVEITARSIRDLVGGRGSRLGSLGSALDALRTANFDGFSEMFAVVDGATVDTLGSTLSSLTPVSAFSQTFTANSFSQRFTGQIAQRTLALRGADRAAGGFSAAGNASYAIAGTTPGQAGALGIFGSASGVYLNGGQQNGVIGNGLGSFSSNGVDSREVGANAFEQASLTQAGEMTIGADLQVSEGFSFGVAVSNIRNSEQSTSALQPQEDRSQSVAIYATWSDGGLFADGYVGTSNQEFGVERSSQGDFSTAYSNAIGQADGEQTFGGMRLGYAFDLAKGVEVGPVVSMDYVRNEIGGYDEVGAGAFGLSVADRTFTSMGAKAGAMASFDIQTGNNSSIRAFGSVAYARELADTADVVTARFFGAADTPFTIANELDPQWVSVNAGAEMALGENLRASVSVTSDMGRGALSNDQGRLSLSWRF